MCEKQMFIKVLPARLGSEVARAANCPVIAARALAMRLGSRAPMHLACAASVRSEVFHLERILA